MELCFETLKIIYTLSTFKLKWGPEPAFLYCIYCIRLPFCILSLKRVYPGRMNEKETQAKLLVVLLDIQMCGTNKWPTTQDFSLSLLFTMTKQLAFWLPKSEIERNVIKRFGNFKLFHISVEEWFSWLIPTLP